jgi:hypothetical protein
MRVPLPAAMMTMSRAMQRSLSRCAIIGGLLLILVLLGGCSTLRFAYTQGPHLAYWWLDRYVDFDQAQGERAHEEIERWFRWHRSTQLPDYAMLVERARSEITQPATPEQMCRWMGELTARLDRMVVQALPPLAEMVLSMSPAQIDHLARKYERNDEEYRRDFLQRDPEERLQAQMRRASDRAELLYGHLNDAQRERIRELTLQSPFDPEGWLVERRVRQQDTLQALRRLTASHAGPDEARAALQLLYENAMRSPRPAYRDYQQRLLQFNCGFAAQVHNLATPEQRVRAARRLQRWEADLRVLAGQGR